MKNLRPLYLLVLIFFVSSLSAQNFEGIAIYKSQQKMDIRIDSTQMDDRMYQQMMAMLKKQLEKEYTLEFNKNESVYKVAENLDKPDGMGSSGVEVIITGSGEGDLLYKNIDENRFSNQIDLFGKIFLIKDELKLPVWQLEKETKNIGEHTCFKATYKREVTKSSSMTMTINSEEETKEPEKEKEEQTVTAWYTLQIPIKHGPGNYSGLPGLILEINNGGETILCSEIILNPKSGVNITEPKKGKIVTQEKFDAILKKKTEEMNEQFNSSRKDDGHSIEIKIGG